MKTKKKRNRVKRKGRTNYPNIGRCAEALNVSRTHLWYVLEGERIGRPGLIASFWKESERITNEKKGGGK